MGSSQRDSEASVELDWRYNNRIQIKSSSETEKRNRGSHHKSIDEHQEPKIQRPIPLELTKVNLRRLLVRNLQLLFLHVSVAATHLHLPELLRRQSQTQLVASPLVLESVDASQRVSHGYVEGQMR